MVPTGNGSEFTIEPEPNYTYRMDWVNKRIVGHIQEIDGIEAVKQVAMKILMTERFIFAIYDWFYGLQIADLFGMPHSYVESEYKRRAKDALMADDRIRDVVDFKFSWKFDECNVLMMIVTDFGESQITGEVTWV